MEQLFIQLLESQFFFFVGNCLQVEIKEKCLLPSSSLYFDTRYSIDIVFLNNSSSFFYILVNNVEYHPILILDDPLYIKLPIDTTSLFKFFVHLESEFVILLKHCHRQCSRLSLSLLHSHLALSMMPFLARDLFKLK